MTKRDKLHKFIRNPIFISFCALLALGLYFLAYYLRIIALASYKTVNAIALSTLVLSIINVYIVYRDTKSSVIELIIENVPGLLFFISFIGIKLVMRG